MAPVDNQEKINEKLDAFEYLCSLLYQWYGQVYGDPTKNDLSKLKTLKLHFFISAFSVKKDNDYGLLTLFDNFVAMPYGPVELTIYDNISHLGNIEIDTTRMKLVNRGFTENIDVKLAFFRYRGMFPREIRKMAFELVDESHEWESWYSAFNRARVNKTRKEKMDASLIYSDAIGRLKF